MSVTAFYAWRNAHNMTQMEAANHFNVSLTTWNNWESGRTKKPHMRVAQEIGVTHGIDGRALRIPGKAVRMRRSKNVNHIAPGQHYWERDDYKK